MRVGSFVSFFQVCLSQGNTGPPVIFFAIKSRPLRESSNKNLVKANYYNFYIDLQSCHFILGIINGKN